MGHRHCGLNKTAAIIDLLRVTSPAPVKGISLTPGYFTQSKGNQPNSRPNQLFVCRYRSLGKTIQGQCVEKKNQLDANEWYIALIICSTCFGHFYAHHQELETICVLLPPMVCSALVAGFRRSGAGAAGYASRMRDVA